MAPFHLLGQDDQKEMQKDNFGHLMHWHWYKHHVMPLASSISPLYLFNEDNQNEVPHDFYGDVMHLVLH